MADSIREQITQKVMDRLLSIGRPEDCIVERYRTKPLERQTSFPAIIVYVKTETSVPAPHKWGPIAKKELILCCECRTMGDPADQVLDPFIQWIVSQLIPAAVNDKALDGLASAVAEHHIEWHGADADVNYAAAAVDLKIEYQHVVNDSTRQR